MSNNVKINILKLEPLNRSVTSWNIYLTFSDTACGRLTICLIPPQRVNLLYYCINVLFGNTMFELSCGKRLWVNVLEILFVSYRQYPIIVRWKKKYSANLVILCPWATKKKEDWQLQHLAIKRKEKGYEVYSSSLTASHTLKHVCQTSLNNTDERARGWGEGHSL